MLQLKKNILTLAYKIENITVKPAHAVTSIKQSSVLNSQTCPCGHLYQAVICIKRSNLPMRSPLTSSRLY
jgi:hypothetical protein